MTRCNACNGVITRTDLECYSCGEAVPGTRKLFWSGKRQSRAKAAAPVTLASNLLFMTSLVLTGISFFSSQKLPLPVTATLSVILLVARIVTDRRAASRLPKRVGASSPSNEIPPALLRRITLG